MEIETFYLLGKQNTLEFALLQRQWIKAMKATTMSIKALIDYYNETGAGRAIIDGESMLQHHHQNLLLNSAVTLDA